MNDDTSDRAGAIVDALRAFIAGAAPGTRLPTTRALVERHGASPVTVQRALARLQALGLVESRPGSGTFVRAGGVAGAGLVDYGWQTAALGVPPRGHALPSTQQPAPPEAIAMRSGYPAPELLPERAVAQALARAARGEGALRRAPAAGSDDLRAWFAAELGPASAARDVVVLPGSQAGLGTIFRAAVGAGHPLLVESPTYWGAIIAAERAGVELVPVAAGPHGPDPEEVERAFARTGARAMYAQPRFSNPTGAVWPDETVRAIRDTVRRRGAFLIEDDWARDLAIDGEPAPLAADDPEGHVVYLRSLTKSTSPALRVAAVLARGPVRERILADHAATTMYVSPVLQRAALDVVTQPAWRTHRRRLREGLRDRRDLLLAALTEHAPAVHAVPPRGGVGAWVRLPDGAEEARVVADAERAGLLLSPGSEWFPAEPAGPFVRMSFAAERPEVYAEAARILASTLA